jgi:uncharacterized membrane protein
VNALRLLPAALALTLLACKPQAPTSATQAPAPAASGQEAPAAPAEPARAQLAAPPPQHWQCGELRLTTRFQDAGQASLDLLMSGRRLPLRAAPATEGTRFADASGNEFAQRPGGATLTLAGRGPATCVEANAVSPWVDATLRGMAWRMAGSEPGWFAEVSDAESPSIRASVDNGHRTYTVGRARRVPADEITWSGPADNGAVVTVVVERSSCTDAMSGEDFEATATLTVSGQTFRGCAASLKD